MQLEKTLRVEVKTDVPAKKVEEMKVMSSVECGSVSARSRKHITFTHYKCGPKDVTINGGVLVFHDGRRWCTVVAASGSVGVGEKGYYEVTFQGDGRYCFIGWASNKFLTSENSYAVGSCAHSYGYSGTAPYKRYNNKSTVWGAPYYPHLLVQLLVWLST